MKKKAVLLIYGSGGHEAQMKRLVNLISVDKSLGFLAISDNESNSINSVDKTYFIPPLRDKFTPYQSFYHSIKSILSSIASSVNIFLNYDVKVIISTGPGISIFPTLIGRALGKKVIFVETWSRFYSKSLAGRVMYFIANDFYVQNKELLSLYPKAKYGGKL